MKLFSLRNADLRNIAKYSVVFFSVLLSCSPKVRGDFIIDTYIDPADGICAIIRISNGQFRVYKQSLKDTEPWIELYASSIPLSEVALSPDGRKLAFTEHQNDAVADIILVDIATRSNTRVVTGMGRSRNPVFSPDGSKILVQNDMPESGSSLLLVDVSSSNVRQLTFGPSHVEHGIFVDERTVVFARAQNYGRSSPIATSDWHDWDLCEIDTETEETRRLTDEKYYHMETVRVNPETREVLFLTEKYGPMEITRLTLDDAKLKHIAPRGEALWIRDRFGKLMTRILDFQLSPSGNELVLVVSLNRTTSYLAAAELFQLDLPSGTTRQLTHTAKHLRVPQYSWDGSTIVFVADVDTRTDTDDNELWRIDLSTDQLQNIELPKSEQ